jgi:hypothetical protein
MIKTELRIEETEIGYIVRTAINDTAVSKQIEMVIKLARETLGIGFEGNEFGVVQDKQQAIKDKNLLAKLLNKANINFEDKGIIEIDRSQII